MSARDVIAKIDALEGIPFGYSAADAILSALRSAGWAVVPVEPTEGMLKAGYGWPSGVPTLDRRAWSAMLKAAQEDSRE